MELFVGFIQENSMEHPITFFNILAMNTGGVGTGINFYINILKVELREVCFVGAAYDNFFTFDSL